MPMVEIVNHCPLHDGFRVQQIAGMFDVPLAAKLTERLSIELPPLDAEAWSIGLIVGPSGSGKTTLARKLFGADFIEHVAWPADCAVVDCFGDLPTRDITGLLTAVGFSSPPSWIKSYGVLSGGERFRCDLARALAKGAGAAAEQPPLVAFDEFTSVVDRTVAKIGSAAVAKAIRGGNLNCRFVAVTCHYDVIEWLAPDWVIDMASKTFERRRLRRPPIQLDIFRCRSRVWPLFATHHYLSGSLNPSARCYIALWQSAPVALCATLPIYGRRGHYRVSRIVTLPDYQGIGIGLKVVEAVADLHIAEGLRMSITASHPAVVAHCRGSPLWRATGVRKYGAAAKHRAKKYTGGATGRAVVSFEYAAAGIGKAVR